MKFVKSLLFAAAVGISSTTIIGCSTSAEALSKQVDTIKAEVKDLHAVEASMLDDLKATAEKASASERRASSKKLKHMYKKNLSDPELTSDELKQAMAALPAGTTNQKDAAHLAAIEADFANLSADQKKRLRVSVQDVQKRSADALKKMEKK